MAELQLSLKSIEKLLVNSENVSLCTLRDIFNENKGYIQEFLSEYKHDFWIKFTVNIKEILYSDDNHDIFLHFLKLLLSQQENNIKDFYEDINSNVKTLEIIKRTIEANKSKVNDYYRHIVKSYETKNITRRKILVGFIHLFMAWKCLDRSKLPTIIPKLNPDYNWTIPKSWLNTAYKKYIGSIEFYLLEKYSSKTLTEYFAVNTDKLIWFKFTKEYFIGTNSKINTEKLQHQKSDLAKVPWESLLKDTKRIIPADFPRTSVLWLLNSKEVRLTKNINEIGFFQYLRDLSNIKSRIWNMLELACTPYMKKIFHKCDIIEMKNNINDEHIGVAAWFSTWCNSFGITYLSSVDKLCTKLKNIIQDERLKDDIRSQKTIEWMKNTDEFTKSISSVLNEPYSPMKYKKYQTNQVSDILFEPCIIIQLPWNMVLFQQWLFAAFIEILLFEKVSLEFRHWPMSSKVEIMVRKLLNDVTRTKERIVFGFSIITYKIVNYENIEELNKLKSNWILDLVVLPSLAVLRFLVSGKGNNVLKSLKKHCWSSLSSTLGYHFIDFEAYSIKEEFETCDNLVNSLAWYDADAEFFDVCLFEDCTIFDLNEQINLIKNTCELGPCPHSNNTEDRNITNDLNSLEEFLMNEVRWPETNKNAYNFYMNKFNFVYIAHDVIQNEIINKKRLPHVTMNQISELLSKISSSGDIIAFYDIDSDVEINHCDLMKYLHVFLYARCLLLGCEKETSPLARCKILELEIVEKEALFRIILYLSRQFKIPHPIAINLESFQPIGNLDQIEKEINLLHIKINKFDREWLWSQFDNNWRKPVVLIKKDEKIHLNDIHNIQDRIGKLIFNLGKMSLSVGIKKTDTLFPYWTTIQYILPSMFAIIWKNYIKIKDSNASAEMKKLETSFKFINELLKVYENKFLEWSKNPSKISSEIINTPNNYHQLQELHIVTDFYQKKLEFYFSMLFGYDNNELDKYFGYDIIKYTLSNWPNNGILQRKNIDILPVLGTWISKKCHFLIELTDTFVENFKTSLPLELTGYEDLRDMHLIDNIIQVLEYIYYLTCIYVKPALLKAARIREVESLTRESLSSTHQWRINICKTLAQKRETDNTATIRNPQMCVFIFLMESNKMIYLYNALKEFRKIVDHFPFKYHYLLTETPQKNNNIIIDSLNHYLKQDFSKLDTIIKKNIFSRDYGEKVLLPPESLTYNSPKKESKSSETQTNIHITPQSTKQFVVVGENKHNGTQIKFSIPNIIPQPNKSKVETKTNGPTKNSSSANKCCRNCQRQETKFFKLTLCSQCLKIKKFPLKSYFCKKQCEESCQLHKVEHLEFELNIM